MPRYTAHRDGVLIVHITWHGLAAPDAAWRNAPLEPRGRLVHGLGQGEWLEDLPSGQPIEWNASDLFLDKAQKQGVEVTVLGTVTGRAQHRLSIEQIHRSRSAPPGLDIEGHVALEAAGMVQEHAHGDFALEAARKPRQVASHGGIEVQLSLLHQAHRDAGRAHDFGNRGDIPQRRIRIRRGGRLAPGEVAIAPAVQQRIPPADHYYRAGIDPLPDPVLHRRIDVSERLGPSGAGT